MPRTLAFGGVERGFIPLCLHGCRKVEAQASLLGATWDCLQVCFQLKVTITLVFWLSTRVYLADHIPYTPWLLPVQTNEAISVVMECMEYESTRSHWSQNGNGQVFFGALLNFQYPTWVWRGMSTKIDYRTEIFRPLMVQKVLYCRSPPWLLTLQANEAISVVIQCMECDLPDIIDLKMDMSKGSLEVILNFRTDIWSHMWSIWRGVAKLHSYGFLPRDLNASRILLEGNLSGKTKAEDHNASGILILLQSGGCTYFKTWWAFMLYFVNYQLGKDAQFGQHLSCFCISDELDQWNWILNLGAVFSLQVEVMRVCPYIIHRIIVPFLLVICAMKGLSLRLVLLLNFWSLPSVGLSTYFA